MIDNSLSPGSVVRLVHDPHIVGVLVGESFEIGGQLYRRVRFGDGTKSIPSDQVEPYPDEPESPVDLLQSRKLTEPSRLRQVLTHLRLTGRLADLIYSMEVTNTDFHAYQFKPVLKILGAPSGGILIADEVGLGKTIEAGLIWTELRARYDCRRLLILCPNSLRTKWRDELLGKFGVDARIMNAEELLDTLQSPERNARGFAAICSFSAIRPPRGWSSDDAPNERNARRELAKFLDEGPNSEAVLDLLVVDEAHHLRNPETLVHRAGRLFRSLAEHAVFLSATPIHNRNQDLFSLLNLLDPTIFDNPMAFTDVLNANAPLIELRERVLRTQISAEELIGLLDAAHRHHLNQGSKQVELIRKDLEDISGPLSKSARSKIAFRLENANLLAHVINRTRRRDVADLRVHREPIVHRPELNPLERQVYDALTDVIVSYAETMDANAKFLLASPQRLLTSSFPAAIIRWAGRLDLSVLEDDEDFELETEEFDESVGPLASKNMGPLVRTLAAACSRLGDLRELEKNDTKYDALKAVLLELWATRSQEKVVLFSSFRTTLDYLARRLRSDGISVELMHGSVPDRREDIVSRFSKPEGANLLLSSEVGSEGIDLQFSRMVINYDLPWNPMRIEQRIGRIDRLGQTADKISIINLLNKDTIDDRIYQRLYEKLDLCRQALGDFEAILGDEVQILSRDLLANRLTPEQQEKRIDDAAMAIQNRRNTQDQLETEAASLIAHGDFILRRVTAAHELNRWISGDDLQRYVSDFFSQVYPGSRIAKSAGENNEYEITLDDTTLSDLDQFVRDHNLQSTSLLSRGGGQVRYRFTPTLTASQSSKVEHISHLHALIRFVSSRMSQTEGPKLRPAVAARVTLKNIGTATVPKGHYAVAISRWSLVGTVTTDKLAFAGLNATDRSMISEETAEALVMLAASEGNPWPEVMNDIDCGQLAAECDRALFEGTLRQDFARFVAQRKAESDDRADVQLRSLNKHERQQSERLREMRGAHESAGRQGLARAAEARLQTLRRRCALRRDEIAKQRVVRESSEDIAIVVISVE